MRNVWFAIVGIVRRNVVVIILGVVMLFLSTLAGLVSASRGGSFLFAASVAHVLLTVGVLIVGYIANELGLGE